MTHRESDVSDADSTHLEDSQGISRKRSSRACDQCRKTKSKCERPNGDGKKCKNCALSGSLCTFLGPSYKRGPPKGYIHAIEQRWHQVESLLGAILQCPDSRVRSVVSDLQQDDLAREILHRVDMGPYGPSGRRMQSVDSTKEDFFASVLKSNEMNNSRDPSRSLRQSRVSREIVSSSQDHGLSVVPTKEWQDNLSNRLASLSGIYRANTSSYTDTEFSDEQHGPVTQKRRLNISTSNLGGPPDWSHMYTIDPNTDDEDFKDATDGLGQLSLDEHQEVRFHGKSSGLPLLGRSLRTDDRNEGGIWRLPMARVWPASKFGLPSTSLEDVDIHLPPPETQDILIDLYFTYIHPVFPVIHKSRFLAEYHYKKQRSSNDPVGIRSPSIGSSYSSPRPEPTQEVTPLLLLSMCAVAARFRDDGDPMPASGKMWEGGSYYLESARHILGNVRNSRPSAVQSLLLLGYREFGIGSMEQGWLFIGMAIRMAFDLGLNRDSSKWKMHGHDLFSPEESRTRCQIWWVCCLSDRYASLYMGRPITIKDGDFDTPLPDVDAAEDLQLWQPLQSVDDTLYHPVHGRVMSSFCAVSRLSLILGSIISNIYPVRPLPKESRHALLVDLESRLDQWYFTLPEHLRYEGINRRTTPPPQILFLHIRYWAAVLLLHRAFIPNWKMMDEAARRSTTAYRAFDLAGASACHISSIVTVYRETFSLRRASPFLTSYLLNAGVMHVLTLTLRTDSVEAPQGLQQCMAALKEMEIVWPSASRAWELLNGVHLAGSVNTYNQTQYQGRNKRLADDAFGQEKNPDYLQRDAFGITQGDHQNNLTTTNGVQDLSARLMAHMLGLEIPGIEPSTSYFPGYEWWPRTNQGSSRPFASFSGQASDLLGNVSDHSSIQTPALDNLEWMQGVPTTSLQPNVNGLNYPYDFLQFGV